MTKENIKEQFFEFLKENSCYNKYFNNINSPLIGFSTLEKILRFPIQLINFAFDWDLSEEGYDYWNHISNKWILKLFLYCFLLGRIRLNKCLKNLIKYQKNTQ